MEFDELYVGIRWIIYIIIGIIFLMAGCLAIFIGGTGGGLTGATGAFVLSSILFLLFLLGIPYIWGMICFDMAKRSGKKNPNYAFIWGFITGLLGVILYWIYSKLTNKNHNI